mgnify:CR=1 FL=1
MFVLTFNLSKYKILLEVTCGTGAFMENEIRARVLAQTMVNIGKLAGKETIAVLTNMNQPLGKYSGNALEVIEAIETLKGNGEPDVNRVCTVLGAYMLKMAGKGDNILKNKDEDFVIEGLRFIEPRVKNFIFTEEGIFVDIGIEKRIPINMMGDGVRKIVSLLTAI